MRSNTTRVIGGIAVVVIAVVLLIALQDDGESDDSKSSSANAPANAEKTAGGKKQGKPSPPTIVIRNGEPVGGIAELTYDEGDRIRFRVKSDASEEIHVHGYDVAKEVAAGGSVEFDIAATIEGVFEAELEGLGVQIAEITVNP